MLQTKWLLLELLSRYIVIIILFKKFSLKIHFSTCIGHDNAIFLKDLFQLLKMFINCCSESFIVCIKQSTRLCKVDLTPTRCWGCSGSQHNAFHNVIQVQVSEAQLIQLGHGENKNYDGLAVILRHIQRRSAHFYNIVFQYTITIC